MTDSIRCTQCQQKPVRNTHNKCIYCGAGLPEALHMSEVEARTALEEKNRRWEEDRPHREKADKPRKPNDSYTWDLGDLGGGDACGGDGGC